MKIHIKSKFFILMTMFISLCYSPIVFAAVPKEITSDSSTIEIADDQIVQALPEGGYIFNSDGNSEFDSEVVENNNGVLMTYKEYKSLEKKDTSLPYVDLPVMTRAASPSTVVNNPKTLQNNQVYRSDPFSESGWRFSHLKFKAAAGTGTWLRWTAIGDGGCVGNEYEAYRTYQTQQAVCRLGLAPNQSAYANGEGSWLFFYTYNPVKGSRYLVENK